jgi:hypothetical protein
MASSVRAGLNAATTRSAADQPISREHADSRIRPCRDASSQSPPPGTDAACTKMVYHGKAARRGPAPGSAAGSFPRGRRGKSGNDAGAYFRVSANATGMVSTHIVIFHSSGRDREGIDHGAEGASVAAL